MKHLTINDVQPEDYRFIIERPDENFSPERNYATIQKVIADTDKFFSQLDAVLQKDKEDRIDVLASYARYRFNKGEKKFEDYVGKEWMTKIIGERILSKVRVLDSVQRLNRAAGNTKYTNFTQL